MSWSCNQEMVGRQKVGEKPFKERLRELGSPFPEGDAACLLGLELGQLKCSGEGRAGDAG